MVNEETQYVIKPFSSLQLRHESPHVLIKYKSKPVDSSLSLRIFQSQSDDQSRILSSLRRKSRNFSIFPQLTAMKNFIFSLFSSNVGSENNRRKDQTYLNATIELAIFVDQKLYNSLKRTFPQDTERHVVNVVSAMMNAVQILFDDEALGHKIRLVIKRLEVLNDEPEGLEMDQDIEKLLKNFCKVRLRLLQLTQLTKLRV